ncbi:hypothetical protein ACCI51_18455 [Microbulbifer echini]|uniref:Uncharacterized protein n=1 Tax=Microbulbifer echini TaxID=1529067 RepID=A0ABV4NTK1_9GAMM
MATGRFLLTECTILALAALILLGISSSPRASSLNEQEARKRCLKTCKEVYYRCIGDNKQIPADCVSDKRYCDFICYEDDLYYRERDYLRRLHRRSRWD